MYKLKNPKPLAEQVRALPAKDMRSEAVSFLRKRADSHIKSIQLKFYSGHKGAKKPGGYGVEPESGKARAGWKAKVNPSGRGQGNITIYNDDQNHDYTKEQERFAKPGSAITVPVGPALNSKGQRKYRRSRDAPPLTLRKLKNGGAVLVKTGEKDTKRTRYYVLAKKITIPAYTADLPDHMNKRFAEDFSKLEQRLAKKFG